MSKRQKRKRGQSRQAPRGWPTPFPLPRDTARIARDYDSQCLNLGLWLDRYVKWRDWDDKGKDSNLEQDPVSKQRQVPMLEKDGRGLLTYKKGPVLEEVTRLFKAYVERHILLLTSYRERGLAVRTFTASPQWRFVVGLGRASVLETSIALHHLYGMPIIPGSALKGLARAFAETLGEKAPDDPEVVTIFGTAPGVTPMKAGGIVFFDAVPVSLPCFRLDVMTPHYGEYYRGEKPPADYLTPNPIYFLTVEKTEFLFALAARISEAAHLLSRAEEWLRGGLKELGIGAKTTVGYGYF